MSLSKTEKLVRMANQIGDFFAPQPEAQGAAGVATHLKKFWTPKMIGELLARASEPESGLNTTAARGIDVLRNHQQ